MYSKIFPEEGAYILPEGLGQGNPSMLLAHNEVSGFQLLSQTYAASTSSVQCVETQTPRPGAPCPTAQAHELSHGRSLCAMDEALHCVSSHTPSRHHGRHGNP